MMLRFGITVPLIILQRRTPPFFVYFYRFLVCLGWCACADWYSFDYHDTRTGTRTVGLGEKPYFDAASKSKREALHGDA